MAPSLISGYGTVNLCPLSACSSWTDHRGVKFKLLLQPANSIRSRKDAQRWVILAPFLVRGEGLPFAAHTAGVITPVYHCLPCLLHPSAVVMPDGVAALSISAPRGQAIRSRVPKRQTVRKRLKRHLYCFQFGQSVLFTVHHPHNAILHTEFVANRRKEMSLDLVWSSVIFFFNVHEEIWDLQYKKT